jgi:hypothetical protein
MFDDDLNKYNKTGHFFFKSGDDLSVVSTAVPHLCGVYYIYRLAEGGIDLVQIGKSGFMQQNGACQTQPLFGEDYQKTQKFFEAKWKTEKNFDGLDIYWFATVDKNHFDLPSYVEGLLMQRYFELYGRLPLWNKSF